MSSAQPEFPSVTRVDYLRLPPRASLSLFSEATAKKDFLNATYFLFHSIKSQQNCIFDLVTAYEVDFICHSKQSLWERIEISEEHPCSRKKMMDPRSSSFLSFPNKMNNSLDAKPIECNQVS